jgi:hypothetical protein
MKLEIRLAGLVGLTLAAVACTPAEPPSEKPAPRAETVFDPLVETVDRARGVQQTIDDGAAERRRRIEEQER